MKPHDQVFVLLRIGQTTPYRASSDYFNRLLVCSWPGRPIPDKN